MPKSALPERLQDPNNWKGTDDDVWYMRWRIPLKGLFAYGPLAKEWWAKWREWPICIFFIRGKGPMRYENDDYHFKAHENHLLWYNSKEDYVSRIQYWTRWHFQFQWPFFIAFHFYFKQEYVADYPSNESIKDGKSTDNRLFYFYFGAHRDSDKVYWFPSAFIGLTWK